MQGIKKQTLDQIENTIRKAGLFAKLKQKGITTSLKADGSPVTEVDLEISRIIIKEINTLLPECNIISEESLTPFSSTAPFSFILDPIDGTDVYSQGLPSFAIALGILDNTFTPVGAMIFAPRFGIGEEELFIRLDPGAHLLINNREETIIQNDEIKQITMSSKGQKLMNFDNYKGKVRTFGSTILHLVAPIICPHIAGSVTAPCYVWDFAASHAVLLKCGYNIKYTDLSPVLYDKELLIERKPLKTFIYAGTEKGIETLYKVLPLKTV